MKLEANAQNQPTVLPPLKNSETPFAGPPTKPGLNAPAALPYCPPGTDPAKCAIVAPPQSNKEKEDAMSKLGPILNALSSAMGGGSGGAEPADSTERMAAGYDGGANGGQGGYSPAASTTYAQNLTSQSQRGQASIVEPFKKWFDVCTEKLNFGKCSFRNDGIWGDASHMSRRSCHNVGAAIDVGLPLKCTKAGVLQASDQKAMEVAKCMASQTQQTFKVIFRDQVQAEGMTTSRQNGQHSHHMHIKLRSCPW